MTDDELEFQKLYNEFKPKIFRYIKRLAGEYAAEDLTQDVFIKVSNALKSFRGESQISTWIY
jgi:RNA polymerase sigma-70 factor (ECF subfamily)